VWIAYSYLDFGETGRRLLWAYLLPYGASWAVMAIGAGRQGRPWAREEWRLHLTALCLAPVLSVGAAPVFRHALDLDRLTALSAGVAIGCGMLAFAATTVVSLRVMNCRREPTTAVRRSVSGDTRAVAAAGAVRRGTPR
jgi:hypothetical protein